jgi:ribosomal protein L17
MTDRVNMTVRAQRVTERVERLLTLAEHGTPQTRAAALETMRRVDEALGDTIAAQGKILDAARRRRAQGGRAADAYTGGVGGRIGSRIDEVA